MAFERKHLTAADGTFSATGATEWDRAHAIVDAVSGGIPYFSSTTAEGTSALLASGGVVLGGGDGNPPLTSTKLSESSTAGAGLTIAAGTATTDVAALSITRTNNNAAVATGVKFTFTDTTSAAGFLAFQVLGGGAGSTNLFSVDKNGTVTSPTFVGSNNLSTGGALYMGSDSGLGVVLGASQTTNLSRISNGLVGVGTGAAGSFAGRIKATSGIVAAVAVGALNATPTVGEIQTVNDALAPVAGAAVAAGGAANALVWWNGAQWTVVQV